MTPSSLEKALIERAKAENPAFKNFVWSVSDVRFTNKLGKNVMAVDLTAANKVPLGCPHSTIACIHIDVGMEEQL